MSTIPEPADHAAAETITEIVSSSDAVAMLRDGGMPAASVPIAPSPAGPAPADVPPSALEPGRRGHRVVGPRFLGRAARQASEAPMPPSPVSSVFPDTSADLSGPGAQAPAQVDARLVSAWFGEHQVLQDVSLTMLSGMITALIGPSGCGKSTFLRMLNRMHELVPSASLAGEVLLDGADIYEPTLPVVEARKRIGMVFQKPNPFPAMSIYDNVLAGLALTGVRADRARRDFLVESCLTKAGLWTELKDRLRSPGGGLSGGQQQRLCIARSLAVRPRVLLMDEPCSALDPTSTRVIEETMLELAQEVTIVIVTHNMQQAQRVSQQCAFFLASQGQPGHIVEHGDTDAMFAEPIDPRTFDYVNGRFG
jgi:phosphate transport system ATP-binding protein